VGEVGAWQAFSLLHTHDPPPLLSTAQLYQKSFMARIANAGVRW